MTSDSPGPDDGPSLRWAVKRPDAGAKARTDVGSKLRSHPSTLSSVEEDRLLMALARRHLDAMPATAEGEAPVWQGCAIHAVAGRELVCDPSGIAYWPAEDAVLVADLHLEKGAAFARRGQLVPPFDTATTLRRLSQVLERWQPSRVFALGDSFHDERGAAEMPARERGELAALMSGRDWVWIAGNHDPKPPEGLGGECCDVVETAGLTLIHEPDPDGPVGEIAGHLHPKAVVVRRGRAVSRSCFAADPRRMVMPSFGAYTGGLSVFHTAFDGLFQGRRFHALMRGERQVYRIAGRDLSR